MNKEKVLITGGAGYLGNAITRRLLDEGVQVACLDNLMYRQDNSILPLAANPDFEFVYGDVRDEGLLKEIVPKYDTLIPLAAIVGMPACKQKPFDAISINRDAVISLNRIRSPSQKLIYPNTNSGYGTKSGAFYCTEETPLEPISLYGIMKCEAEKAVLDSDNGLVFRLASVFGVSSRMRLELSFHDAIMQALTRKSIIVSEGESTRNYIYIGDIASAFNFAVQNYSSLIPGKVYNLGSDGANISKIKLAEKVRDHIPGTMVYEDTVTKDPDKRNYMVSNDKLRKAGFEANTSIDKGIAEVTRAFSIVVKNDAGRNL
jgi:nucleoside-diphosphate-sugar epimerase